MKVDSEGRGRLRSADSEGRGRGPAKVKVDCSEDDHSFAGHYHSTDEPALLKCI